ncbi:hypothetical protein BG30_09645 [Bacillus subtilis subsp. subtilis]|nr:hypothetical protein BG30_09645 [Bacillus subtilis subsp. subtilis]
MELQKYLGDKGKEVYIRGYIVNSQAPSLLIVPNIGWYHVGPNRFFTQLANKNFKKGMNTYIFDYIGEGESRGYYKDITIESIIYSFNITYNYVRSQNPAELYCLSIGVGNLVLNEMHKNIDIDGSILYLPDYTSYRHLLDIFSEVEVKEAIRKGFFEIKKDKSKKHLFWRSIVGPYHDCAYNPISTDLINSFIEYSDKEPSILYSNSPKLVISDKKELSVKNHTDIYYVPEYKNNILPTDWKLNDWPKVISKVNNQIVSWINKNKINKNKNKNDLVDYDSITTNRLFEKGKSVRKLMLFSSNNEALPSVLHSPLTNKMQKKPCVIFIPGLGGDKVDNFLCGPRLGDYFAERGIHVFRYDNRYSGSSKNSLEDFTWTKILQDFNQAMFFIDNYEDENIDNNQIFLVSWSEGAKIVSYAASRYKNIKGCCMWNPILLDLKEDNRIEKDKGEEKIYSPKKLPVIKKFTISESGNVVTQLGGEFLSTAYFSDNNKYNFYNLFSEMDQPTKVIWGTMDMNSLTYQLLQGNKGLNMEIFDTDHHLFNYDLIGEIIQTTFEWFEGIK